MDIEALRATVAEADAALAAKRLEAAAVTREIASLQRQIDRVPSQIELTQYQRRFVELYNLSEWVSSLFRDSGLLRAAEAATSCLTL